MVNNEIWKRFPWRWISSSLTAISLVDGTQDYTVADADFDKLTKAWLTRTDTTPDQYQMLDIVDFLPPQLNVEKTFRGHRAVAYVRTSAGMRLRLEYSVQLASGVTVQIDGEYKANPTKITALSSTIPFDDRHFDVLINGMVYYIFRWDNDDRAGEMRIDRSGNRTYTGAFGTYINSLDRMAASEDPYDSTTFPEDTLGDFDAVSPGLFF